MTTNSSHSKKKSRRNFVRSAIVGLGAIPLASLDRKAKAQTLEDERQSSPIIIGGGGSVGIDFNTGWYKPDSKKKGFHHSEDTLHKLWLIDKHGALFNVTPRYEDCTVTIYCGKSNGKEINITIEGKPLGIDFDPCVFRYVYPPGGKKQIYHAKKLKISKITIRDNVAQTTTEPEPPTKSKCTIVVVNTL